MAELTEQRAPLAPPGPLPAVAELDPGRVRAALAELLEETRGHGLPRTRERPLGDLACCERLQAAGLVDADCLPRFRVNRIGERLFVTDLPEQTRNGGVFPYEDEAMLLLERLAGSPARAVVDVGVGCGHVLLSTAAPVKAGLDVSPRAGELLRLNAALNGERVSCWVGEPGEGESLALDRLLSEHTDALVTGNLPHAPVPSGNALATFADGGRMGSDVIQSLLEALAAASTRSWRLVLLCYSLCTWNERDWLVPALAERLLPGRSIAWNPLDRVPMWRVDGEMTERSPMPLATGLPRKADCPYYTAPEEREAAADRYSDLAAELEAEGWDSLGYGVLEVSAGSNGRP